MPDRFFSKIGIPRRAAWSCTILIVNALVWYGYATALLVSAKDTLALREVDSWVFYGINFGSATTSMILGAWVVSKSHQKQRFLMAWTFVGVIVSAIPVFLNIGTFANLLVVSTLMSGSFGLGFPSALAQFSDVTVAENRSKFAAVMLIVDFLAAFGLKSAISGSTVANFGILAIWRAGGLIALPFLANRDSKEVPPQPGWGIRSIQTRSYTLYLIPWLVFSVVNSFAWNIFAKSHGEGFVYSWSLIERIVQGVSAVSAGFIADRVGRKRVIMSGLILFGLGYAILGIGPDSMFSWYFFTVADGVAWGIIYVIFLFTIWGDLAYGRPSENHYAIGILPYSMSSFMQVTVASLIANAVPPTAVFSLAAFFLFLAVMPLMYAPETLPEKKIQERELRVYLEKAKRVKQKYA